jgi:hypothetical protein
MKGEMMNLTLPIARSGEPIYASIIRNRSGVDSGDIDYGARVFEIEKLSEGDKQDICDTAYALYKTICQYTGKKAKIYGCGLCDGSGYYPDGIYEGEPCKNCNSNGEST